MMQLMYNSCWNLKNKKKKKKNRKKKKIKWRKIRESKNENKK